MDIRELVTPKINPSVLQIAPGDTVKLSIRTTEGDRERLQHFQGMVIRARRGVDGGSFTVRKVSYSIGVEYTFPSQSPSIQNIEILKRGKVRRAKLYYMRQLTAKQSRLKERQEKVSEPVTAQQDEASLIADDTQLSQDAE